MNSIKDSNKLYSIGLKLWSINTDFFFEEAKKLYSSGVFHYIELYVIPDSLKTLMKWATLKVPFVIHCPHYVHGFNLAQSENELKNISIYQEVKMFADTLNAAYIIFHGGNRGCVKETARQLANLSEPRALIENKPYHTLPKAEGVNRCLGATPEEIRFIMDKVKCGFCLDFGHAICSANSQGMEPYQYIKEFMLLNPTMFHIAGIKDITSPIDSHLNLVAGKQDPLFFKQVVPPESMITIETIKDPTKKLKDFIGDVEWLQSI